VGEGNPVRKWKNTSVGCRRRRGREKAEKKNRRQRTFSEETEINPGNERKAGHIKDEHWGERCATGW